MGYILHNFIYLHALYTYLKKKRDCFGIWIYFYIYPHFHTSLAVCFKRPNGEILKKFVLSGHWLNIGGEWRQYVHIYIMDGVTRTKIDELIEALHTPGAFNWLLGAIFTAVLS